MSWWRVGGRAGAPRWRCPMTKSKSSTRNSRFLVRAHPQLATIRALEIAVVFSGNHNDPESWWDWADKDKQEEHIKRFKRKFAIERPRRPTRSRFWS